MWWAEHSKTPKHRCWWGESEAAFSWAITRGQNAGHKRPLALRTAEAFGGAGGAGRASAAHCPRTPLLRNTQARREDPAAAPHADADTTDLTMRSAPRCILSCRAFPQGSRTLMRLWPHLRGLRNARPAGHTRLPK